jgi:hypothetical protein
MEVLPSMKQSLLLPTILAAAGLAISPTPIRAQYDYRAQSPTFASTDTSMVIAMDLIMAATSASVMSRSITVRMPTAMPTEVTDPI